MRINGKPLKRAQRPAPLLSPLGVRQGRADAAGSAHLRAAATGRQPARSQAPGTWGCGLCTERFLSLSFTAPRVAGAASPCEGERRVQRVPGVPEPPDAPPRTALHPPEARGPQEDPPPRWESGREPGLPEHLRSGGTWPRLWPPPLVPLSSCQGCPVGSGCTPRLSSERRDEPHSGPRSKVASPVQLSQERNFGPCLWCPPR